MEGKDEEDNLVIDCAHARVQHARGGLVTLTSCFAGRLLSCDGRISLYIIGTSVLTSTSVGP